MEKGLVGADLLPGLKKSKTTKSFCTLSPRRAAGKQDSIKELVALIVETFKTKSVLCVLYTVPQLQCSNPMTLLQDDSGAKVYIF